MVLEYHQGGQIMANNTGETGNTHWVGANAYVSFFFNLKWVNNFGDLEVDTRITEYGF